ncbi:hypothetical protein MBLNU13_g10043t1 [Cladosporium sp. NU13]
MASANVRVSGNPNSNFLVGYPGISATLPRLEGKVEIRPGVGVTAPVHVSMVTIHLQRREMINPTADSLIRSQVSSQRREITDMVGRQMCLYKVPPGRDAEAVLVMDLPFMVFIPFGRGGEEVARRVPPASLQLDKRTAETFYELVVELRNGSDIRKYAFPVPIARYDTLSTFGMYNRPESAERTTDHIVTLGISLPRWSYGPLDPVSVYIKLSPNADWMSKAKRVTIQSITVGIEEEIIYNHEGDEPSRKTKVLAKHNQTVGVRMPEAGYFTNLGLVFPARELRDSDGILPRGKKEFPTYAVSGFTTTGTLYKIEYYLTVKAKLSSARDILLRQPIVVCPFDHAGCKEEMEAIEQAAKDAAHVSPDNPLLPPVKIIKANDPAGLRALGIGVVGGNRKPYIDMSYGINSAKTPCLESSTMTFTTNQHFLAGQKQTTSSPKQVPRNTATSHPPFSALRSLENILCGSFTLNTHLRSFSEQLLEKGGGLVKAAELSA